MSEDEVESFEITDYDLENEFNINRPRRKLTKKQQMLGKNYLVVVFTSLRDCGEETFYLFLALVAGVKRNFCFRYLGRR